MDFNQLKNTCSEEWDNLNSENTIYKEDSNPETIASLMETVGREYQKSEKELKRLAIEHKNTLMMGRTHGIHAEPITIGSKMALWYSEISRHIRRLQDATKDVSVGKISGAVGTHATVPLELEAAVCKNLVLARQDQGLRVASRR